MKKMNSTLIRVSLVLLAFLSIMTSSNAQCIPGGKLVVNITDPKGCAATLTAADIEAAGAGAPVTAFSVRKPGTGAAIFTSSATATTFTFQMVLFQWELNTFSCTQRLQVCVLQHLQQRMLHVHY